MKYSSTMAQAWIDLHTRAIAFATTVSEINNQNKKALIAVNNLRSLDIINIDEYTAAVSSFNAAARSMEVANGK